MHDSSGGLECQKAGPILRNLHFPQTMPVRKFDFPYQTPVAGNPVFHAVQA